MKFIINNREVRKMKKQIALLVAYIVIFIVFFGCSDSSVNEPEAPQAENLEVVGSSGQTLNMNGEWKTACTLLGNEILREIFRFSGDNLIIVIETHTTTDCESNPASTEIINITYEAKGTLNVSLDGQTVRANKISGTAFYTSSNRTETFKQSFYIDDSQASPRLYHGVFGDDGGQLRADGYPLELHNVAIEKQ